MIYSVTGKLIEMEPAFAVVQAGGVGYKCTASINTLAALPKLGSEVTLLTHLYIREDVLELFGFLTRQELELFRLLISVSGVGPKAAIAMLSASSPERLILAIAAGDHKALKAPGVGPKTAQRVVMELRDKVGAEDMTHANADFSGMGAALAGEMTPQGEAISALVALGYSQTDAAAAVARLDSALPTDGLVRGALKLLSRGV